MLAALSIWHPESIPPEEFKYRNLKRIWLPVYDFLAIWAGVEAALVGSPLLNRIFPGDFVDGAGATFTVVASLCLVSVAFPRLWRLELVGKVVLVGMIAAYAACILLYSPNPDPNHFVVLVLAFSLPLPLFRLNLLGEEIKERRAVRQADARSAEGA